MFLLELENISFGYAGSGLVIKDVSLKVNDKDFLVILGPNGSGKTTLLKLMTGLLKPAEGDIRLGGKNIASISRKDISRKIAYVPQSLNTVFPFSVYEIVMMGRTPYLNAAGFSGKKDNEIVEEALETVEITHLRNKGLNEISGGEAQRAFIARALAQKTKMIMLDEPNAHLDIKHQISLFNLLRQLNTEHGYTIITVSHDLNLAGYFGKRGILLKDGSIYDDNSVKNIVTEENILKVFGVESKVTASSEDDSVSVTIHPG